MSLARAGGDDMPWFVAKRAIVAGGGATGRHEYRVFSEAEIEAIGPEWDWASFALDSREEAQALADDRFWEDLED